MFVDLLARLNLVLSEAMPPEAYAALQRRFERDLNEITQRELECHTVSVLAAREKRR